MNILLNQISEILFFHFGYFLLKVLSFGKFPINELSDEKEGLVKLFGVVTFVLLIILVYLIFVYSGSELSVVPE
ncbi:MAG: hypothetical protein KAR38_06265 [Calditrichia bacterium]|nr:hypothetical protein [Calditrichia bacterium]